MCFKRKTFKSHFLCNFIFFSSLLSLSPSLSLSLSFSLSPSPSLLFPSLLPFSRGFCLDRVLAEVKNGFANCIFEMQRDIL